MIMIYIVRKLKQIGGIGITVISLPFFRLLFLYENHLESEKGSRIVREHDAENAHPTASITIVTITSPKR